MKFIWAFLETLFGLLTIGFVVWLIGWGLRITPGKVEDGFSPYFLLSLIFAGFLYLGGYLVFDGIQRGNK